MTLFKYSYILIFMRIQEYAEIFKALAHPIRLKIVCGLSKKDECNVNEMCEKLGIAQPTVSQHLNILKNADIVTGYRDGNKVCYRLENDFVMKMIKNLEVDLCEH